MFLRWLMKCYCWRRTFVGDGGRRGYVASGAG